MTDDVAATLASIVQAQQQQIDDTQRLLVTLADAVLDWGGKLPDALNQHAAALNDMIERGEQLQRAALARAESRRKEVEAAMGRG